MQRGPAISVWLTMSGVGVRMAAMMKLIRMAYFRFFEGNCGVTMPSMDRSVITTGSTYRLGTTGTGGTICSHFARMTSRNTAKGDEELRISTNVELFAASPFSREIRELPVMAVSHS